MGKSILTSVKPKIAGAIIQRECSLLVKKSRPKIDTPFKCYIYCTKGENLWLTQKGIKSKTELAGYLMNGKVIGEFVCDWITEINPHCDMDGCANQYIHGYPAILGDDCLSFNEMKAYLGNKKGYDWHISDLVIYEQPKELSEFWAYNAELNKLFNEGEDYCAWGRCETESGCTNDCDTENILNCYQCWADWSGWCHRLTRPFQSWGYVEGKEKDR